MSTEREAKIIFGYALSNKEVTRIMKSKPDCWDEEYLAKNEGYDAMNAEELASAVNLGHCDMDGVQYIGVDIQGSTFTEQIAEIQGMSERIKKHLMQDSAPLLHACTFSY